MTISMAKSLNRIQPRSLPASFALTGLSLTLCKHRLNSSWCSNFLGLRGVFICSQSLTDLKHHSYLHCFSVSTHSRILGLQTKRLCTIPSPRLNDFPSSASTLINQSLSPSIIYRTRCGQTLLSLPKYFSYEINRDNTKVRVNYQYQRDFDRSKYSSTASNTRDHDLKADAGGKSLFNRFLFVSTLKDFYEDVPDGIIMDTAYADSRPDEDFDKSLPVIVGLHDTPGDHKALLPLMDFFAKLGCRTVCPTFPGHGQTKGVMRGHDDIFCQSTLERATFVSDFLNNLDIERVDILVGVGASCYTSMALCTLEPQVFQTTALISPWPMSQPRVSLDANLLKRIQGAWDTQFFRLALKLLLSAMNVGDAKTLQEKIVLASLLSNLDFGEVQSHGMTMSWKKRPYIVAYGGQDEEIDQSLRGEMMDTLGINSNSVTKFNGILKDISIPGALVFPDCDYNILTKKRSILCAYLFKLLQTLHPSIKV